MVEVPTISAYVKQEKIIKNLVHHLLLLKRILVCLSIANVRKIVLCVLSVDGELMAIATHEDPQQNGVRQVVQILPHTSRA